MRLAVVAEGTSRRWAEVRDDLLHLLDGNPWTALQPSGDVLPLAGSPLLAPVRPTKIMCVGRNYSAHSAEMGYAATDPPSIFMKPPTTIIGPGGDVVLPPSSLSRRVEHEAELAVVIGRAMRFTPVEEALASVLGFTCANDVSARDLQRTDAYPTRAKGFDTFCPVGPWIETNLDLSAGVSVTCSVNGSLRQDGSSLEMVYDVPRLLSHLSQFTTLLPGDLVLTGSPGGTGSLQPGDAVEVAVSGVGVLRHGVVGPQERAGSAAR